MKPICLFFTYVFVTFITCHAASACNDQKPCLVETGEYYIALPKDWEKLKSIPAVVFLHGYDSSAEEVMANQQLRFILSEAGVILIAPQGEIDTRAKRTWSFPNGQTLLRNDFIFIASVVNDAESKWPIDKTRVLGSGFSIGASMIWYMACETQNLFTAYAPIAGAFWNPEPTRCQSGPISLRHIHGLADKTVPMIGRYVRDGTLRQGDVLKSIDVLRKENGCPIEETFIESRGNLICRRWASTTCSSGHDLVLCLHDGEHMFNADWVLDAVYWMNNLSKLSTVNPKN